MFLQEGDSLNNQFIQGVIFDWNRIDEDSYLKNIEAFKGEEQRIIFFLRMIRIQNCMMP